MTTTISRTGHRLPPAAHTEQPWRIHDIAPDFDLEDVWALPTPGGPDDFPRLVERFVSGDVADNPSWIARTLFTVRWWIGGALGWDGDGQGLDQRVASLRERLPADLRVTPGPDLDRLPFRSLYLTDDEWAMEIANSTVHAVSHLSWVRTRDGSYRGQMAVLVRPNGRLGEAYMAAIRPFRYVLVYPPLMRGIGASWDAAT
ncbi:DUF2867 domain-containing protein [Luteipulveratus flavus]|uniref:DUF2867 domain-containing protein n=1 Tax=Luteipulveratus flavus TaxID=3031728 RepID=A0ABT6C4E2_9MICO|nr:DUF2867 domain-containing protein [Luteipulveratus sp. YIM 133296]MDF8263157.1 DUF2867 domain-containing protein [Luteipulveratus sp. YIM 133296]